MWQGEIDCDMIGHELKVDKTSVAQVCFDPDDRTDVQAAQKGGQPTAVQLDRTAEAFFRLKVRILELDVRIEGGDLAQRVLCSQGQCVCLKKQLGVLIEILVLIGHIFDVLNRW